MKVKFIPLEIKFLTGRTRFLILRVNSLMGFVGTFLIAAVFLFPAASFARADSNLLEKGAQSIVQNNSAFGFDLYQKLKAEKGNLFFSPYSISTALSMAYTGARGKTKEEMAKVLHFTLKQELLHKSFSSLQSYLKAVQDKGEVKLSIANSLWAQKGYHFLDSFLELNKRYYGAGLKLVDFTRQTELARKTINAWVEERTHNKIKELVKQGMLDELTRLVLVNVIYLKGS